MGSFRIYRCQKCRRGGTSKSSDLISLSKFFSTEIPIGFIWEEDVFSDSSKIERIDSAGQTFYYNTETVHPLSELPPGLLDNPNIEGYWFVYPKEIVNKYAEDNPEDEINKIVMDSYLDTCPGYKVCERAVNHAEFPLCEIVYVVTPSGKYAVCGTGWI